MLIVYYSHVGNTRNFVNNHLYPDLYSRRISWPDEPDNARVLGPEVIEVRGNSPHRPAVHMPDLEKFPNERIIVVFPVYARANVETGELEDTVPRPMRDFIALHRERIIGAVVCGNRTFGAAYGAVNPQELDGIEILGLAELSGTDLEARRAGDKVRLMAMQLAAQRKAEEAKEKDNGN